MEKEEFKELIRLFLNNVSRMEVNSLPAPFAPGVHTPGRCKHCFQIYSCYCDNCLKLPGFKPESLCDCEWNKEYRIKENELFQSGLLK